MAEIADEPDELLDSSKKSATVYNAEHWVQLIAHALAGLKLWVLKLWK